MATEAKPIGRRPLQPRDSNVVSPGPGPAAAATQSKSKAKARTRLGAAATPASPPSVKSRAVGPKEVVSLGEELEKARERRGRLRAARRLTDRVLDERGEALRREAREWARRAGEQRRLVAELMRVLVGMPVPEIYAPVESLRSREGRKRKDANTIPCSGSAALQEEEVGGMSSCGQESEAPATTTAAATTSELSTV